MINESGAKEANVFASSCAGDELVEMMRAKWQAISELITISNILF